MSIAERIALGAPGLLSQSREYSSQAIELFIKPG